MSAPRAMREREKEGWRDAGMEIGDWGLEIESSDGWESAISDRSVVAGCSSLVVCAWSRSTTLAPTMEKETMVRVRRRQGNWATPARPKARHAGNEKSNIKRMTKSERT